MRESKTIVKTLLAFLMLSGLVLLISCEQDPCLDLMCKNGAACVDGFCECPTGYEGAECEIHAASKFVGTYAGTVRCEGSEVKADTVIIDLVREPDLIRVKLGFGNTSLLSFEGRAETPESHFVTHVNDDVEVHVYVTVNGDRLFLYLETLNKSAGDRQVCKFQGERIREEESL